MFVWPWTFLRDGRREISLGYQPVTKTGAALSPPKQVGAVVYDRLGWICTRFTKGEARSVDAKALDEFAEAGHEVAAKIVAWRGLDKLVGTYTEALPRRISVKTGRIHTSFSLSSCHTGRLASSGPNLQNVPRRTEDGRKIRRAFIAPPGHKLISADYSQVEIRLLAEIGNIAVLKRAFHEGRDIHAVTASEVFRVSIEGMSKEVRDRAKAINFGIIYGRQAPSLARELGIPVDAAQAYIELYLDRLPGVRDYIEDTKRELRFRGYVTTMFGRKCAYPQIFGNIPNQRSWAERAAVNARIQGSAADIIRRAMIRMGSALADAGLSARMSLQVHDELLFEVPDDEVERAIPVIRRVMAEAPLPDVTLSVPLTVDVRAANNWDEAH
jgi:DNA polymerase-1